LLAPLAHTCFLHPRRTVTTSFAAPDSGSQRYILYITSTINKSQTEESRIATAGWWASLSIPPPCPTILKSELRYAAISPFRAYKYKCTQGAPHASKKNRFNIDRVKIPDGEKSLKRRNNPSKVLNSTFTMPLVCLQVCALKYSCSS
jgi:hypothetical protein